MAFSSIAKDFNKESIVQAVRDFEYYTKQELSQKTSLSFPTTSKIVDELVSVGMIKVLCDKRGDTGGRKAYVYQLDKEYAYSLCIAVAQGSLKAFVINMDNEMKSHGETVIKGDISAADILEFVQAQLVQFPRIRSVVIGVPGAVHRGKIFLVDGFSKLQNCDLQHMAAEKFCVPVAVLNNMNALIAGCGDNRDENIACIHIGEKGPGCSCLVNGAPVSGFCGFQGELGFSPYDEKRTFRDIALGGYQDVEMEQYIGRLAIQLITLVNPEQLMLYLPTGTNRVDIGAYCRRYLPAEVIPQIVYPDSYEADYIDGLAKTGVHLLFAASNKYD
ncbi:MAG: ROK family protein [Lachnospiraceae bacterium]|nr:ROK family protein [Lachnospiraceae bacterium]